jgi:hypothetical protein
MVSMIIAIVTCISWDREIIIQEEEEEEEDASRYTSAIYNFLILGQSLILLVFKISLIIANSIL